MISNNKLSLDIKNTHQENNMGLTFFFNNYLKKKLLIDNGVIYISKNKYKVQIENIKYKTDKISIKFNKNNTSTKINKCTSSGYIIINFTYINISNYNFKQVKDIDTSDTYLVEKLNTTQLKKNIVIENLNIDNSSSDNNRGLHDSSIDNSNNNIFIKNLIENSIKENIQMYKNNNQELPQDYDKEQTIIFYENKINEIINQCNKTIKIHHEYNSEIHNQYNNQYQLQIEQLKQQYETQLEELYNN